MSQDTIQYLVLDRCDPSCNMARYYVLSIEPSLFGDTTLLREWGRLGRGREGSNSTKAKHAQSKPLKSGSSESVAAAICFEAGRGQKYRETWISFNAGS
jgi:predicted DNA-binding WGR domain protein